MKKKGNKGFHPKACGREMTEAGFEKNLRGKGNYGALGCRARVNKRKTLNGTFGERGFQLPVLPFTKKKKGMGERGKAVQRCWCGPKIPKKKLMEGWSLGRGG